MKDIYIRHNKIDKSRSQKVTPLGWQHWRNKSKNKEDYNEAFSYIFKNRVKIKLNFLWYLKFKNKIAIIFAMFFFVGIFALVVFSGNYQYFNFLFFYPFTHLV